MRSTSRSWPEAIRQAARSLYLRRAAVGEISATLGVPVRTLYNWVEAGHWDDLLSHEGAEEATARRLALLIEREAKQAHDLKEIDTLVTTLERLQRLRLRERGQEGGTERGESKEKAGGKRKKKPKNDVSHLCADDFAEAFHKRFFAYQRELLETRKYRNRFFLKSRQIGFTWYFAQEAFEDACLTGDNQIFLSATRAQSEVFRSYIVDLAKEAFGIELKGNPLALHTAHGTATLYFLSNNSRSAQSYHGHVYIDEAFWVQGFNKLYKVATGMAAHKKWRRTLLSTPSAVTHEAYDLWTGDRFQKRFKTKRAVFPSPKALRKGAVCPDTFYRKIITLEDAIAGGCNLFDIEGLRLEYSGDEFRNLFLCEFVDDTQSVFKLADLERCYADTETWTDFDPNAARPLGTLPVWGGYDPSRSRDDASFVIVAPPLKEGGAYRLIARYKWLDKSYMWQAERIRELVGRYNFQHIGVDVTGPGIGVFEQIRSFFPQATPILYSIQNKAQLVLRAKELIEEHRLQWDAAHNDIAHAFLTIRQGTTDSGQITYSASRTSSTGHADVAWATMHALEAKPLGRQRGGCVIAV
ncbi:terminase large subunit domain-containing protein [Bilophila wadsworthia]|uniref:terminase large subunit domain-containing protein n=1 Tax=Bilophila wadsworthia TaxID=35833 RepID=UPI003062B1A3